MGAGGAGAGGGGSYIFEHNDVFPFVHKIRLDSQLPRQSQQSVLCRAHIRSSQINPANLVILKKNMEIMYKYK